MPELRVKNPARADLSDSIHTTGEMRVLDKSGDQRITWNARDADEVTAAKHTFDDLVGKRFKAYAVTGEGGKGEEISEFDPNAQKLILVPPMAGGEVAEPPEDEKPDDEAAHRPVQVYDHLHEGQMEEPDESELRRMAERAVH